MLFGTLVVTKKLGTGQEEYTPAVVPYFCIFPISLLQNRHDVLFVGDHVVVPGFIFSD